MAAMLPIADDVIDIIKEIIETEGVEALESHGYVQLYSGPMRLIRKAVSELNNRKRAKEQAKATGAKLIDDVKIGNALDNYDNNKSIYTYFQNFYPDYVEAVYHADKVMRFASCEFIKACRGKIETAVCGAHPLLLGCYRSHAFPPKNLPVLKTARQRLLANNWFFLTIIKIID